jgi:hypothetical protein
MQSAAVPAGHTVGTIRLARGNLAIYEDLSGMLGTIHTDQRRVPIEPGCIPETNALFEADRDIWKRSERIQDVSLARSSNRRVRNYTSKYKPSGRCSERFVKYGRRLCPGLPDRILDLTSERFAAENHVVATEIQAYPLMSNRSPST